MGYEGIKTALAASKGEKVSETVDTGVEPHHQREHEYRVFEGTADPGRAEILRAAKKSRRNLSHKLKSTACAISAILAMLVGRLQVQ